MQRIRAGGVAGTVCSFGLSCLRLRLGSNFSVFLTRKLRTSGRSEVEGAKLGTPEPNKLLLGKLSPGLCQARRVQIIEVKKLHWPWPVWLSELGVFPPSERSPV